MAKIDNSITNSPIINSPGSVQAPGGSVIINQRPPQRKLTPQQHEKMLRVLSEKSKGDIEIDAILGDPESIVFGREIVSLFQAAGWSVEFAQYLFSGTPTGLVVQVRSRQGMPIRVERLFMALDVLETPYYLEEMPSRKQEHIILIVGHHP